MLINNKINNLRQLGLSVFCSISLHFCLFTAQSRITSAPLQLTVFSSPCRRVFVPASNSSGGRSTSGVTHVRGLCQSHDPDTVLLQSVFSMILLDEIPSSRCTGLPLPSFTVGFSLDSFLLRQDISTISSFISSDLSLCFKSTWSFSRLLSVSRV